MRDYGRRMKFVRITQDCKYIKKMQVKSFNEGFPLQGFSETRRGKKL
jgi:hypothetical protein